MDAGLRNRYDALLKDLQSAIKRTEHEMAESKFKIDDPRLEKYKEHIRQLKKFRGSLNAIESAHKDARAKGQFFNASTTALAFNRIAMIEAAISSCAISGSPLKLNLVVIKSRFRFFLLQF